MLKWFRLLFLLCLQVGAIWALDNRLGMVPPLGRFLDPFGGFWQNATYKQLSMAPRQDLPGLSGQEAYVVYDSLLIPHIYAQSDEDLYFLQGYVTAQHRLWQMEFQTYAASGRISEIVGAKALDFDRLKRRKGLAHGAAQFLAAADKDPRASRCLQAYAAGVNAWIEQLDERSMPLEYKLLDYRPEPWTPLKTALLLKYMADDLAGWDADFEYSNFLGLFGQQQLELLFPERLNYQEPVVSRPGNWSFKPVQAKKPQDYSPLAIAKALVAPKPHPDNGSNNWALAPSKTKEGNALLCNDPHLGLNLPSIWFVMQLSSPTVNVMGATLPGAPDVIIGFNEHIAWGVTNARRDVIDWYRITFQDSSRQHYLLDGKWKPVRKVVERIAVRGGETVLDTVCYTHWGPVVYDRSFMGRYAQQQDYAMRWTAHDPSLEVNAFHHLNRARNYDDYRMALRAYQAPAQNFIFASREGDIAMTIQGKFPLKWEGQGKFVLDGSRSDMGWQGYIPFEHNVHEKNPARGFVSSANQHAADLTYPYYQFDANYEYFRNRRIHQLLALAQQATPEDMRAMLDDNFNLRARESLPFMLSQLAPEDMDATERRAYRLLKEWDYYDQPGSMASAYYDTWFDSLKKGLWDELKAQPVAMTTPADVAALRLLRQQPKHPFMDIKDTPEKEDARALLRHSFRRAVKQVRQWELDNRKAADWASYKGTTLQHLLRLDAFSNMKVRNGGNRGVINATSERHGPSWRMLVELDKQRTRAWGIYPGGQSGNPGSYYYNNLTTYWEGCQLQPLQFLSAPDIRKLAQQPAGMLAAQLFTAQNN